MTDPVGVSQDDVFPLRATDDGTHATECKFRVVRNPGEDGNETLAVWR